MVDLAGFEPATSRM